MIDRVHPYAIVPGGAASLPPELRGIRGAPVSLLPAGPIGAWISRVAPIQARAEDLRAHHAVVEAACQSGPALPVRFGSTATDEAALVESLAPRAEALLQALGRIGSKRELAVTLTWREPLPGRHVPAELEAAGAGPGRRFMLERAQRWSAVESRRERATDLDAQLAEALRSAGLDRASVKCRIVPAPRVALSCAVLIEPAQVEDVMRCLRDRSAEWSDVQLHLAGPWPPYSFSDGE